MSYFWVFKPYVCIFNFDCSNELYSYLLGTHFKKELPTQLNQPLTLTNYTITCKTVLRVFFFFLIMLLYKKWYTEQSMGTDSHNPYNNPIVVYKIIRKLYCLIWVLIMFRCFHTSYFIPYSQETYETYYYFKFNMKKTPIMEKALR